jgi:cytoskeletal protein CcmA (bactofilin family)
LRDPAGRHPVRIAPEQPRGSVLTVGRDITLHGDITACDTLVVEGSVEATSFAGRHMDVTESGVFKGNAQVDDARIAGQVDGELVVRDRLCLAATARVTGRIRYARLEVEAGGQLCGEVTISEVAGGAA